MKRDQISSLVWLGFGIFITIESLRLEIGDVWDPGPGFLPLGTGILLSILSFFEYLESGKSQTAASGDSWYSRERWPKLAMVVVALFIYILSWPILGFIVSTVGLLLFFFIAVETQKWFVVLAGPLLITLFFYVLFDLWLKTQLPKGIWGF